MNKIALLFIGLFFGGIANGGLMAQDVSIARAVNGVTFEGRSELSKSLSDPGVGTEQKRLAIIRLGDFANYLHLHKDVAPSELFNPILGALSLKGKKYESTRMAACQALVSFADKKGSNNLVGPLGRVLNNQDETFRVRRVAAIALGRFHNDSEQAVEQLTRALTVELDKGPEGNNISFATTIINGMGKLGDKRSFVVLMRVIDSAFPAQTMEAAQKALENIKWD